LSVLVVAGLFLMMWNLLHRRAGRKSMHDSVFDRYRSGESMLHRMEARVKVVIVLIFILSNVLLPDTAWGAFILSYLLILLASWLSGLGLGFTFRRSFIALPFALAAVTAIFSIPGRELATWHLGATVLTVTDAGALRFISIMLRAWVSVQAAILLVATTSFPDLIHALEHLRVPRLLVTVIAFLYRYLFVLTDEVLRLTRARQARSASVAGRRFGGTIFWRARVAGNMVGQLFLRSYARSDRIYNAMLARGYTGQMRTLSPHQMSGREWLFIAVSLTLLALVQIVGRL
jgi:cobalt/nickel transport system permease protein